MKYKNIGKNPVSFRAGPQEDRQVYEVQPGDILEVPFGIKHGLMELVDDTDLGEMKPKIKKKKQTKESE